MVDRGKDAEPRREPPETMGAGWRSQESGAAGSGLSSHAGAKVRKAEQVRAGAQMAEEEFGKGAWLEVDGGQCPRGQGNGLEVVFAAGGVGELRAVAVTGIGGPGAHAGEVDVLAFVTAFEDVQQAVDVGGRGEFLVQLPG